MEKDKKSLWKAIKEFLAELKAYLMHFKNSKGMSLISHEMLADIQETVETLAFATVEEQERIEELAKFLREANEKIAECEKNGENIENNAYLRISNKLINEKLGDLNEALGITYQRVVSDLIEFLNNHKGENLDIRSHDSDGNGIDDWYEIKIQGTNEEFVFGLSKDYKDDIENDKKYEYPYVRPIKIEPRENNQEKKFETIINDTLYQKMGEGQVHNALLETILTYIKHRTAYQMSLIVDKDYKEVQHILNDFTKEEFEKAQKYNEEKLSKYTDNGREIEEPEQEEAEK